MIGTMLPCSLVVQQTDPGVEIAAVVQSPQRPEPPIRNRLRSPAVCVGDCKPACAGRPEIRLDLGDRSVAVVESWTNQGTPPAWMPESLTA